MLLLLFNDSEYVARKLNRIRGRRLQLDLLVHGLPMSAKDALRIGCFFFCMVGACSSMPAQACIAFHLLEL